MRLTVKKNDGTMHEFEFSSGPVYIGRHTNSQVFLPDRTVSRQHAVLFCTPDGKWMVEDLDSANKTYLNDEPIAKAEIKTGDRIRIADFVLDINLEQHIGLDELEESTTRMEDTLAGATRGPQVIVRRADAEQAPDLKLPAKRANDYMQATEVICKADAPDDVLQTLLNVLGKQFGAYHAWCALRNEPTEPMSSHAGKARDGKALELDDIELKDRITEAVEKAQFMLLPQVSASEEAGDIRSAMIAPIMDPSGCFGVLYVDNAMADAHYTLADLDYLMLLAMHTAAILENF